MFKKVINVLHEVDVTEYVDVVQKCKDIYDSPEIRIGLWGDFSSGKSSFLNSLLGEEIFPVNITEMTAMVTELRYGEELQLVAVKDGKEYDFPYTQELSQILLTRTFEFNKLKASIKKKLDEDVFKSEMAKITEAGLFSPNMDFNDFIDKVIIKCNFEALKNGLVFVDLPGLKGSGSHKAISMDEIKECSMVIFFKACDRVMSKYDKEVLDDLKGANEKMVLFGIFNKCDLELKGHYSKLHDDEFVKETRFNILNDFKDDVEQFTKMDEYFAISPLMMMYFNKYAGDETKAFEELKEAHPSKFRFLKENHNFDLIAGVSQFQSSFFSKIEELRVEAKNRVIEGKFLRIIKEIDESINMKEMSINSAVELSREEYDDAMSTLSLQQTKKDQLHNYGPKVALAIQSDLKKFLNSNVLKISDNALTTLANRYFNNESEFNHELSRSLEKGLTHFLHGEGKDEFLNVTQKAIDTISNDIDLILEEISNVTGVMLGEKASANVSGCISGDVLNIVKIDSNIELEEGLTGGALALDAALFLADAGTFGLFTICRLAIAGGMNASSGGSFFEGVENVFKGFLSIFDSAEEKQRKAMANLRSQLQDPNSRREISQKVASQTQAPLTEALTEVVIGTIHDSGRIDDEIEAIGPKIEEAKNIVQNTLDKKQLSEDEKRIALNNTKEGREQLNNVLTDFFRDSKIEKQAA
jgi:hypothetical protein